MKSFIVLAALFLFSQGGYANHCPLLLHKSGVDYCISIEWQNASFQRKGSWKKSKELSPQLIKERTPGAKKLYSSALVKLWKLSDEKQNSVFLDGLRVFPYM